MKPLDVLTSPWAIPKEKLIEIIGIYSTHLKGEKIDIAALEAAHGEAFNNDDQDGYEIIDGVAIINVHGILGKKMNMFMRISGGMSMQMIGASIEHAFNNQEVQAIILDIDSPGGTVDGTEALGDIVFNHRGDKPIVAHVSGLMASAAYWIGSAADSIHISGNTDTVGSIGVATSHIDYSEQNKKLGIKITDIYAGKFKRLSSEDKPLTEEGHAEIKAQVDFLYTIFIDTVARNLGVSSETVLEDMADGRIFIGQQAIDAGLVDGISTIDSLISDLSSGVDPKGSGGDPDGKFEKIGRTTEINYKQASPPYDEGDVSILIDAINNEVSNGAKLNNESEDNTMDITLASISEKHPDIAAALRDEGVASVDVAKTATDAATTERERIQAVMDQSMPGHEALVQELAFDGKTSGPEAAVKVLQAEKALGNKAAADIAADAEDLANIDSSVNANVSEESGVDNNAPIEDQCKAKWDADPSIRADHISLESYTAYEKNVAAGNVKILGKGEK